MEIYGWEPMGEVSISTLMVRIVCFIPMIQEKFHQMLIILLLKILTEIYGLEICTMKWGSIFL